MFVRQKMTQVVLELESFSVQTNEQELSLKVVYVNLKSFYYQDTSALYWSKF